jgi:hypothetical protein
MFTKFGQIIKSENFFKFSYLIQFENMKFLIKKEKLIIKFVKFPL